MRKLPHKLEKELRQWSVYLGLIIVLLIVILLFKVNVAAVIMSVVLIVVASFSKLYKRFTYISVGFETITPTVVLFAYEIGVLFAVLSAVLMLMASSFIAGRIDFPSTLAEILTYIILSILAAIFSGFAFVPLAIVLVVLRNCIMCPIGVWFMGRDVPRMVLVFVSDIALNVFLLLKVGEFIIGVF